MAIVSPWRRHIAKLIPDSKGLLFLVDLAAVLAVCTDLLTLFLLLLILLKQPSQLGQKAVCRHGHTSGLLVPDAPQRLSDSPVPFPHPAGHRCQSSRFSPADTPHRNCHLLLPSGSRGWLSLYLAIPFPGGRPCPQGRQQCSHPSLPAPPAASDLWQYTEAHIHCQGFCVLRFFRYQQ